MTAAAGIEIGTGATTTPSTGKALGVASGVLAAGGASSIFSSSAASDGRDFRSGLQSLLMDLRQATSSEADLTAGVNSSGVAESGAGASADSSSQKNSTPTASAAQHQSRGSAVETMAAGRARLISTQARLPASANDRIAVAAFGEVKPKSVSSKTDEKKTISKAANSSSAASQPTLSNSLPSSSQSDVATATVSPSSASLEGAIPAVQVASLARTQAIGGATEAADSILQQGTGRKSWSTQQDRTSTASSLTELKQGSASEDFVQSSAAKGTHNDASAPGKQQSVGGEAMDFSGTERLLTAPSQSPLEKSASQSAASDSILISNQDSQVVSSQGRLPSMETGQSNLPVASNRRGSDNGIAEDFTAHRLPGQLSVADSIGDSPTATGENAASLILPKSTSVSDGSSHQDASQKNSLDMSGQQVAKEHAAAALETSLRYSLQDASDSLTSSGNRGTSVTAASQNESLSTLAELSSSQAAADPPDLLGSLTATQGQSGSSALHVTSASLTQGATLDSGPSLSAVQQENAAPGALIAERGNSKTNQSPAIHDSRSAVQLETATQDAVQKSVIAPNTAQSVAGSGQAPAFTANPSNSGSTITASQMPASVQIARAGTVPIEARGTAPVKLVTDSESIADQSTNQTAPHLAPGAALPKSSGGTGGSASGVAESSLASDQSTATLLTQSSETGIPGPMEVSASTQTITAALGARNGSHSADSKSENAAVSSIARRAVNASRSKAVQSDGSVVVGGISNPIADTAAGVRQQVELQGPAAHTLADKSPAAESEAVETFAAMDASSAPDRPTWVHAGAQQAEAGYQDPALGWVGVRADSSGGGIHAQLVAGSTDAAQTLSGHMAGLNAFLTEHHTPVETLTLGTSLGATSLLSDQGTGSGSQQGAGGQSGQQAGQSTGGGAPSILTSGGAPHSDEGLSKAAWPAGLNESTPREHWVGGHVSVMA